MQPKPLDDEIRQALHDALEVLKVGPGIDRIEQQIRRHSMARYEVCITRKPLEGGTSPAFPIVSMDVRIAAVNDEVAEDIAEELLGHIHRAFGVRYGPAAPLIVDSVHELG